jgi:serine protease AprX
MCGKHFLYLALFLYAPGFKAQDTARFVITFSDRKGSPYSVGNPSAYLSARAILRRTNQGISIKLNDLPVNPSYIDSVAKTGVKILTHSKWLNAVSIDTTGHPNAMNKILALPFVTGSKNVGREKWDSLAEGKPRHKRNKFGSPGSLPNFSASDFGSSFNQATMIGDDCLQNQGYRGEGMVIAVLDGGFYMANVLPAFDSLWKNKQILGTHDFSNQGANVFDSIAVHGMEVLSAMGGYLNGQLIGTAPKASFWLLRSEVVNSEYIIEEFNWASAAEFADSVGADIISSSLGYTTFDNPAQNQTYAQMNGRTAMSSIAAVTAAEKGILVAVAAGNDGGDSWQYIGSPADADSILTVGAVEANGTYAAFSSTGPASDGRIKPTIAAQGVNSIIASTAGGITAGSGTSFATPIAAGTAACLWQANPGKTNMQVIDAIIQSANQYSKPDSLLGYGIPNMCKANLLLSGMAPALFQADNIILSYPNPFQSLVHITFYSLSTQSLTVQLFDVSGRKISEMLQEVNANSINDFSMTGMENLEKGLYILRIAGPEETYFRKLIKN